MEGRYSRACTVAGKVSVVIDNLYEKLVDVIGERVARVPGGKAGSMTC